MKGRIDTVFYHIGKIIWLPVIVMGSWFSASGYERYWTKFTCSFFRIIGMPCPGCGGTRAVYSLFSGEFLKSFLYHPVVLYGVVAYLHFMGLYFFRKHILKSAKVIAIERYAYVAIAVILLQWVIKVIYLLT